MNQETSNVKSGAAVACSALLGGWGIGYTTALGDWILMKIFDSREAAEADLPKWGNRIVPNARFDVRDISQDLLIAAVNSGCPRELPPNDQAQRLPPGTVVACKPNSPINPKP